MSRVIVLKPAVIWLTGLCGSGKTSVAAELINQFTQQPVLLDGDEIRKITGQHSFDELSRKQHNLIVGYIASLFEKQGHLVIAALISPYADTRNEIRLLCDNFIEVYLSTSLEVCIRRDPKGLYQKAIFGEIKDFTGISAPYHPPLHPELEIDTSEFSAKESANKIIKYLIKWRFCTKVSSQ